MEQAKKRQKKEDEQFCSSCGEVIKREAVICPHCGVQVGDIEYKPAAAAGAPAPKDKAVAVILAVFLGFWTWVYTYQKDAWKFWLNLVLSVVTLGLWGVFVAWLWAVIDAAVKPDSYYRNFPN